MNRILISIGPINIYWYSFLIFIGLILGLLIAKKECERKIIDFNFIIDLVCYLVPISIVGARIYYVIFKFNDFKDNLLSILYIWEGGLAIYGAVIAGLIFVIYYCKKKKQNVLKILDIIAPSLILGQAIGRWGNFFNQEAYGPVTTLSFFEKLHLPDFIAKQMYIDNLYRQPTFLYESIWCLLGFIILIIIRKKVKKTGLPTAFYLIWYSIGRFFIESIREDSLYLGIFRISQIVSIIMFIIGIYLLIKKEKKNDKI